MSDKTQAELPSEHQHPTTPGHVVFQKILGDINEKLTNHDTNMCGGCSNDELLRVLEMHCAVRADDFIPDDCRKSLVCSAITTTMRLDCLDCMSPTIVMVFADNQIGKKAVDEYLEESDLVRFSCDDTGQCVHAVKKEKLEKLERQKAEYLGMAANPISGLLRALERSGMGIEVIIPSSVGADD